MIPTWIVLPAQFQVCSSNNPSSETASSLDALADVLGSALLDSHHVDAHCSRRGVRSASMNPVNWAWETVGSSRKIEFVRRRRENVCVCTLLQLFLTLCSPMDCSPPGSSVHGISQARTLEWDCHFLPQGIFPTQGSNLCLPVFLAFQADSFTQ